MNNEMAPVFIARQANLRTLMAQKGIGMVIIRDSEEMRDPSLRYFCGLPSDGILAISIDGTSILSPWDCNLAEKVAYADSILPYTLFDRDPIKTIEVILRKTIPEGSRVEIPPTTPYPEFLKYVDALKKYDILCRENSIHQEIVKMRACKDEKEIETIKKAAKITDELIDLIEENVKNGSVQTEIDIALLIEKECRLRGCEKTGFDTLVAGENRSCEIHCFPNYTNGIFPCQGLSILDFGLVVDGYTSDVTLTFAKGELTQQQEELLNLVEEAYKIGLKYYKAGTSLCVPAKKVSEFFEKNAKEMPHSLGHGIGLEIHEAPFVRTSAKKDLYFEEGMVVTLEPGLYYQKVGGVRLENDILITKDGNEVLTHSRIIRL